jgi:serine protease Do
VDKTVKVTIFREGKERTVKVKVGKLDEGPQAAASEDRQGDGSLGVTVTNLTPELVERYNLAGQEGLLVTAIDPDGPAADANLQVGDLILEVDGKAVKSVRDLEQLVDGKSAGKVLRLLIQRNTTMLYTTVTLK